MGGGCGRRGVDECRSEGWPEAGRLPRGGLRHERYGDPGDTFRRLAVPQVLPVSPLIQQTAPALPKLDTASQFLRIRSLRVAALNGAVRCSRRLSRKHAQTSITLCLVTPYIMNLR